MIAVGDSTDLKNKNSVFRIVSKGASEVNSGEVEPPVRIELTTYRLQGGCSTTELQRRMPMIRRSRLYR